MRVSQFYLSTLKEAPTEADVASQKVQSLLSFQSNRHQNWNW
jgi:hypothetical protein